MNRFRLSMAAGFIFVLAAGSLSHFIYEWSGYSAAAGLFCPVSESTWEHMKLCFFPMLLFSCCLGCSGRPGGAYLLFSMLTGTLAGTFFIPVIFYTYTGILGFHTLFLDILTFFLSVAAGFYTAYRLARRPPSCRKLFWALPAAVLLAICFFRFTYSPPPLGIFLVPG